MDQRTHWTFAPYVNAARIGGYGVFLDLNRDAYSCVPWAIVSALVARDVSTVRDSQITALRRNGLIVEAECGAPCTLVERRAPNAALPAPWAGPAQAASVKVFPACLCAADRLASPIRTVVEDRMNARTHVRLATLEEARAAIAAFHGARSWYPRSYNCLFDCVAMLAFLRSSGLRATWVFGARLYPFAAHCWLEVEDVALGEDIAHLRAFTPLLAV
ncbi:MAG: lasso peptide biosynthesis B2 protein [Hyphomonadaceae bacterium]|nr:lasso peptide biosynthesis B2 protein [Hyphomonadaceae bacterium]